MKILIVKLSAIGDVIHTLPALCAMRKQFPNAHITWLIEEKAAPLVENHPDLDRILVSKRQKWFKDLSGSRCFSAIRQMYRFIKTVRDTEYDIILDFQALLKSGVLVGLARGNRKIGFDKGMQHMEHSYLFLNERIPPVSMEIHALRRYMMMLSPLGIHSDTVDVEYRISILDEDRKSVDRLIKKNNMNGTGPLMAIHPVAKWGTKLWYEDRFAELAEKMVARFNARVIFTGTSEDRIIIDRIMDRTKTPAANAAGETTLKMLGALFERADVVISTDTGPMHLAMAMKAPVVALFGPTAPWRTGPFGSKFEVVRTDMACSPCFKRECETRTCMKEINIDHILEGIKKILA